MSIFTPTFIKATAERAIKTVAQTAAATAGASWTGLLEVDWLTLASVSGFAGLLSVLTSIASGTDGTGPSATAAEVTADRLDP